MSHVPNTTISSPWESAAHIYPKVVAFLDMTIVQITGGMLRDARNLTGLSQQELADRASISRRCLTAWEGSSGSVPNAGVRALHRVVSALEAEGVVFVAGGVHLENASPQPAA